jgi:outer membrane lipoprotein LolB
VTTADPEQLLQAELGWSIPLRALRYWIRAEAAPGGGAHIEGPADQPTALTQFGWELRYLSYHHNEQLALPAKLILRDPQLQATLLIRDWLLGDAVTDCQDPS